jgi:hypothetical protein
MPPEASRLHPIADGLGQRPSYTVIEPPVAAPGYWAGGPSALRRDGTVWLAYRLRRPVDAGRGYLNVVARSDDGFTFETVAEVTSTQFECASLERPALGVAADGTWRLFVSCSTAGSKHWWVEVLSASSPDRFGAGRGQIVLPGDETVAWKDPVVRVDEAGWHLWACRHDIIPAEDADRMDSCYFTSADGLAWVLGGQALAPTPDSWDQRGARITAVVREGDTAQGPGHGRWVAFYDGRADADDNWEERTGVAIGTGPDHFEAIGGKPLVIAPSLRYLSAVPSADGGWLVYYEASRPDGSHDLRVEYVPRPTGESQSA